MKRIQIRGIVPPDTTSSIGAHHYYKVYLGNKNVRYFKSKREAAQYQADTARFLTLSMQEANLLLADTYTQYRTAWPSLVDRGQPLCRNAEERIRAALASSAENLDRASRANGPNKTHFVWKHLQDTVRNMQEAHETLAEWYRYKTQGALRYAAEIGGERCQHLLDRLANYGKDEAPTLPM